VRTSQESLKRVPRSSWMGNQRGAAAAGGGRPAQILQALNRREPPGSEPARMPAAATSEVERLLTRAEAKPAPPGQVARANMPPVDWPARWLRLFGLTALFYLLVYLAAAFILAGRCKTTVERGARSPPGLQAGFGKTTSWSRNFRFGRDAA